MIVLLICCLMGGAVSASGAGPVQAVFPVPHLSPQDSNLRIQVGDRAPDFTLPAITGDLITLSAYQGKKNVVLSFVPAAFTPVCSAQWPMYNMAEDLFSRYDAVVLGIATDNIPSLYAWTRGMGTLWFPVLSDFWPHGMVAKDYGVLRTNGTAERALFIIDKTGVIRYVDVHDINERPPLDVLAAALAAVADRQSDTTVR
ncbi:MAG: peroxiredoxin [Deltaproteobacteria bacterium]|nr:peroxiredoxin [Candidatus Anaeroferrophillus wilburensis]MBN2889704.1 peroxiredoxin [Deltaproteobacteria bacterium]